MKYYGVLIKSHADAPDYEDEGFAESKEAAVLMFAKRIKWDPDTIREWVQEIDIPNLMEGDE